MPDHGLVLGLELQVTVYASAGREHGSEQVNAFSSRAGPTASKRIRPDYGTRVAVEPLVLSHRRSHSFGGARWRPRVHRHVFADTPHEHGHLVSDMPGGVCVSGSEYSKAAAFACRGDEQERCLHLNDRLPWQPAAEVMTDAPSQTLKAGRNRGQMLGILPAEAG